MRVKAFWRWVGRCIQHRVLWRFKQPATLLGRRASYWLARAAGWSHQWRSGPRGYFWTVRRGDVWIAECGFRWRDLWHKPPVHNYRCFYCGRREGYYHLPRCERLREEGSTVVRRPEWHA